MATDIAEYDPALADEQEKHEVVKSAGDMRTESVGRALDAAYAKASTLQLNQEEATALAADFDDEAFRLGAGGNPDLIYIEHAYLRQRLNTVLGVGAAVPVRRREWTEQFHYWKKNYDTGQQEKRIGVRIYVDLVLIVRGCVVGEAIGDSVYYPDNAQTNYSDALEAAKSNAFRRCCKEFGVGLQAWMKGWGEGWKQRNPGGKPKPQAKAKEAPKFEPPKDWPDTEIHDIKLWVETFTSAAQFEAALGLMLNEPALVGTTSDWEAVLRHFAEQYKAKYKEVGSKKMNDLIKAAIDKMEMDKDADATFNREAADAAVE